MFLNVARHRTICITPKKIYTAYHIYNVQCTCTKRSSFGTNIYVLTVPFLNTYSSIIEEVVNFDHNISMYQKEFFVSSLIIMKNSSFPDIIDYVHFCKLFFLVILFKLFKCYCEMFEIQIIFVRKRLLKILSSVDI